MVIKEQPFHEVMKGCKKRENTTCSYELFGILQCLLQTLLQPSILYIFIFLLVYFWHNLFQRLLILSFFLLHFAPSTLLFLHDIPDKV